MKVFQLRNVLQAVATMQSEDGNIAMSDVLTQFCEFCGGHDTKTVSSFSVFVENALSGKFDSPEKLI